MWSTDGNDTITKLKVKVQEVKGAKEETTKLLQIALKAKLKAKDAVLKAEEALQLFGWAEANATDADQHVKDAVRAAKATVTAAKDVAYKCL
ncbi:hypothetical protein DQ04_07761000 [Trypanosoma grayi]|uniref:hypothetical protein n=1 Tax=Trypanosoma grayi TaxID=71804 RepID=UPI0004F4383D|nr:hypothetical protein DQ04_07761000 [Trypanosoma grayi]KEG08196.1 hypothetical protein DQ04_07761000 [Trypanosoma grayi]